MISCDIIQELLSVQIGLNACFTSRTESSLTNVLLVNGGQNLGYLNFTKWNKEKLRRRVNKFRDKPRAGIAVNFLAFTIIHL